MLSFFDIKGLLGATDKRIVTVVGLLFATAFLLVNYTTFRSARPNVFSYELAQSLLRNTAEYRDLAVPDSAWLQELQMHFPWWYVFAGVASLIVAKLLRIEVRMAEDLAGTI